MHIAAEEIEAEVHRVAEHRDDEKCNHIARHCREHIKDLRNHAAGKHQRHQSRVGQNIAKVARHMVVDRAEDAREFSPALTLHDGAEQHQRAAKVQPRRSLFEHCQRNTEEYDPPGDLFKKDV